MSRVSTVPLLLPPEYRLADWRSILVDTEQEDDVDQEQRLINEGAHEMQAVCREVLR